MTRFSVADKRTHKVEIYGHLQNFQSICLSQNQVKSFFGGAGADVVLVLVLVALLSDHYYRPKW